MTAKNILLVAGEKVDLNTPENKVGRNLNTIIMKKLIYAGLFLAFAGFFVYACSKEDVSENNKGLKVVENYSNIPTKSLFDTDNVFFPEGTVFDTIDNKLMFTAPTGWEYVFVLNETDVAHIGAASGSLTCTCTQTDPEAEGEGGCHPQLHASSGSLSCMVTSPCTSCNKDVALAGDINLEEIKKGGYVNLSADIKAMTATEMLPSAFSEMFTIDEINDKFIDFQNEIYGNSTPPSPIDAGDNIIEAPSGYTFVYLNAFGRGLAMLIPVDEIDNIPSVQQPVTVSSVSCNCLSASGSGCDTPIKTGAFITCPSSNCKKCQLNTSYEDEIKVNIQPFRF